MKKCALYVRVSTSHQIDKDSLPFQRAELSNYAKYVLGIDDFEIFEDAGYSAKNTDRPKYQEMMTRIRNKEFSHMLVWKIDRISRNLKDFTEMYDELKDYNITFISKNEQFDTSSAMGEAMLKIILVFAELERKLTAERVFSIMLSRAEKGLWNGSTVPLGYKWSTEDKFPIIDETEANTVKYIYNLYEQTASTTKVAHQLNSEQVKTKRNGKWTAKTINDILRNPFYIGTYRYNVKTSTTRRWKDEKEWIVIENNHPGFIEPSQFEKVNTMLSANYRGTGEFQRENTNTHIFSKALFCGKCDSNLSAGLDRPRSDGYRPSRYTCYSVKFQDSAHHCNNFISDVTLLPFILNYIANFAKLQNKITVNHSLRDIEKALLHGHAFVDVAAIDKQGLEATYLAFAKGFDDDSYQSGEHEAAATNMELENLKKEKIKFEKALTRLEELFLFSEEAMSQKDFLFKKRDLTQNLDRINESLNNLHKTQLNKSLVTDIAFLNKSSNFLMSQHLLNKRSIDYRELLDLVDKELIKDFIQTAISKIVVVDKKVYSITFQNGITHNFAYKPQEQQKVRPKTTFLYRSYEPTILEYLKEHDSITRPLLEELTGLTRASAGAVLKELVDKNVIEKKGHSTATQYCLTTKKD